MSASADGLLAGSASWLGGFEQLLIRPKVRTDSSSHRAPLTCFMYFISFYCDTGECEIVVVVCQLTGSA